MGALPIHIDENYILFCLTFAFEKSFPILKRNFPVLGAAGMTNKNLQDFSKMKSR